MNKQVNTNAEQRILKSIQILPVALMLAFTLVVTLVLVNEENRRAQDLLNGLKKGFCRQPTSGYQKPDNQRISADPVREKSNN